MTTTTTTVAAQWRQRNDDKRFVSSSLGSIEKSFLEITARIDEDLLLNGTGFDIQKVDFQMKSV